MPRKADRKIGFTIIEVVLVLAIAGLIFLMAFVALPALRRSQRDTQRRNDMSLVSTALIQYQANNRLSNNNLPTGPSYWAACTDGSFSDNCTTSSSDQSDNPDVARSFVQKYMNSDSDPNKNTFKDPDGTYYNVVVTANFATVNNSAFEPALPFISSHMGFEKQGAIACLTGDKSHCNKGDEPSFVEHTVFIVPGGKCNGNSVVKSTARHFAVLYPLEGADVYCTDSQ